MSRNVLFLSFVSLLFGIPSLSVSAESVSVKNSSKASQSNAADIANSAQVPPISATVVGSRIATSTQELNDAPSNISLKSKEDLSWRRPLTFQDAVRDEESAVFYDEVGNGLDTTFSLRGFSSSSSVIFLVDGVRVNEVGGNSAVFPLMVMDDLDTIQIERGSASPVYGSNAFAGVVNLTSGKARKKPISMFGGAEWSSFHGLRLYDGVSGTLEDRVTPLKGKWDYYFRGGRNGNKGWKPNSEWRITSFDFKTNYVLPDDKAGFHFGVKHVVDAVSNPGELTFEQFQADRRRTNKPLDGRKFNNTILDFNIFGKLWEDRILAQYFASQRYNANDAFITFGTFTDGNGFNPDTNLVTLDTREFNHVMQIQYEDQWQEVSNRTLMGMEFRQGTNSSTQRDAFGGIVQNTATETDTNAHAKNAAFFWRESLGFFDRVIPYVGMRHDVHHVQSEDILSPANSTNQRWHRTTVSTGITVHPIKPADLFLNYSQGFRVPTIDEVSPFSGTVSSNLNPEKAHSYETGARYRFRDLSTTKFTYFLIDMSDEIVFDSTAIGPGAPFGQNVNITKSRRYGTELREDFQPLKEVKLYGSYTWMQAMVRETNPTGTLADGRSLGQIPENRFAMGTHLKPLIRLGEPYDGLRIGLDGVFTGKQHPASYQSASQATLNATRGAGHIIKGYSVWDFILAFDWKGQEIFFKINNVFNEKYYSRAVNATSFGTAIYPAGTYTFVNPGAPREYVIGSRWEF